MRRRLRRQIPSTIVLSVKLVWIWSGKLSFGVYVHWIEGTGNELDRGNWERMRRRFTSPVKRTTLCEQIRAQSLHTTYSRSTFKSNSPTAQPSESSNWSPESTEYCLLLLFPPNDVSSNLSFATLKLRPARSAKKNYHRSRSSFLDLTCNPLPTGRTREVPSRYKSSLANMWTTKPEITTPMDPGCRRGLHPTEPQGRPQLCPAPFGGGKASPTVGRKRSLLTGWKLLWIAL
jgi:hypothetical protein